MQDVAHRLEQLEKRLLDVECKLGMDAQPSSGVQLSVQAEQRTATVQQTAAPYAANDRVPVSTFRVRNPEINATHWMAWVAGLTFVLAALYFLKLIYDAGWLTPWRQVGIAYLAAAALVVGGFRGRHFDRLYAAYLPAVGLVVLYLTTFVGHLYYQLWSGAVAMGLVGGITLLGIWLGRRFEHSVFPLFSAVGVYITPLLLHSGGTLPDLVIYYSAWSLLFCFCAVQEGRRITYLVPLYLAMLGFDVAFRQMDADVRDAQWLVAVAYQLLQFFVFGVTTVVYSLVREEPVNGVNGWAHGVALFIFYALEYTLLRQHWPEWVNYLALGSAAVVFLMHYTARRWYAGDGNLGSSAVLVSYYCSWVVVHALFVGEIAYHWWPWVVLCLPVVWMSLVPALKNHPHALTPVTLACGFLFMLGYGLLLGRHLSGSQLPVPLPDVAMLIYALMLYGMYFYLSRSQNAGAQSAVAMLYAAHLSCMSVMVHWVQYGFMQSALWAVYGVVVLLVSMRLQHKPLGRSVLMVFVAASVKVLLFDLSGVNSMFRVLALLVISASYYAGGGLYKRLMKEPPVQP